MKFNQTEVFSLSLSHTHSVTYLEVDSIGLRMRNGTYTGAIGMMQKNVNQLFSSILDLLICL